MERVDLDAVRERAVRLRRVATRWSPEVIEFVDTDVASMVAELRDAREVVGEARVLGEALRSGGPWLTELARLLVAIEAYDQAGGAHA